MTHYGLTLGERDGLRVIDCQACGYAHLEALPTEAGRSLVDGKGAARVAEKIKELVS